MEYIQDIIANYVYYAVFLFACIEGEVALLTAGFLSKHGYLSLPLVILTAFAGTVIFEQVVYFIGRIYGKKLLENHPNFKKKARRAMAFLRKYNTMFIFMYRFIYGIRNISPLMIGIARVPKLKYALLNILASIIWATSIAVLGYCFANLIDKASSGVQMFQKLLLMIVLGFALSGICAYFFKKKARGRQD